MNRQFVAMSGVAMVLIVLNHAIHLSLEIPQQLGYTVVGGTSRFLLTVLQAFGVFAVPIFLFISGSFVAYAGRNTGSPSIRFIWSGLQHILWPYLFWSLIFYVVAFFLHDERHALVGYVKNLLVGYPFHFVPLLITFYILSPLLIRLARRFGRQFLLVIGVYQLVLLNISHPGMLGFRFPQSIEFLYPPVLGSTLADWAIYFPMGIVFSLHAARLKPWLERYKWLFLAATVLFFAGGLLNAASVVNVSWARFVCPFTFLFVLPVIRRNAIPTVRQLEQIGKRSYGVYLTHLIVIDLALLVIQHLAAPLLSYQFILFPVLLALGLGIPTLFMNGIAQQAQTRRVFRYVFG